MERESQNTINKDQIKISHNKVIRWVLGISGLVLVGIGILGVFLPLLPTTIFFILAAWCFARSSEKFYHWLHHNRLFGKYLRNYKSGNGMSISSKVFTISFLWICILASAIWGTENLYIRILLAAIVIGVTWHLIAIKTATKSN